MPKAWAINFLQEQLAGGPVSTTELEARAKAEGLSWASLRRAKQQLKIEAIRESHGTGGDGRWLWSLPRAHGALQGVQAGMPVAVQVAQAAQLQTAVQPPATKPLRQRVITVKRPGVAPSGPDELSYAEWESLGHEVGRVREYLARRATRGTL